MTKQEAVQAMKLGKKVTHPIFDPTEWMMLCEQDIIIDELGHTFYLSDFLSLHTSPDWEDGWEIWEV